MHPIQKLFGYASEYTEFISQLPMGFATRIGERRQKLSGGHPALRRLQTVERDN